MSINGTLIILLFIGIYALFVVGKKGFANSLAGFIAFVVTLLMFGIFIRIYDSYADKRTVDLIVSLIVLVALGAVYGVVKIILRSAKAIAKLPIIAVVDSILGAVLGIFAVIAIFHIVAVLARLGYLGSAGTYIIRDIQNSKILTTLAKYDVIELIVLGKDLLIEKINAI